MVKEEEFVTFDKVREIIRRIKQIPCTKCNYCGEVCPVKVPISEMFAVFNEFLGAKVSHGEVREKLILYKDSLKKCIKCGKCETLCPQNIKIRDELAKIEKTITG